MKRTFKFAPTVSKEIDRVVREAAPDGCIVTETISVTRSPRERRSFRCSAICVCCVVIPFRSCPPIGCRIGPWKWSGCKAASMPRRGSARGSILRLRRSRRAVCPDGSGEPLSGQSQHPDRRLWSDTTVRASHRPATVERVAARRWFGGGHVAVSGPALQAFAPGRLRLFAPGPVADGSE